MIADFTKTPTSKFPLAQMRGILAQSRRKSYTKIFVFIKPKEMYTIFDKLRENLYYGWEINSQYLFKKCVWLIIVMLLEINLKVGI